MSLALGNGIGRVHAVVKFAIHPRVKAHRMRCVNGLPGAEEVLVHVKKMDVLQGNVQPVDQFGQNGILSGGTHGYNHHTGPVFTLALQDGFQHGQRHVQIHVVFRGEQPEGYSAGKFSIVHLSGLLPFMRR